MRGEAEAFAIEAKAKAEAEQMNKKAEAWKEYQDAAVVDMVLDTLPKVRCLLFAIVVCRSSSSFILKRQFLPRSARVRRLPRYEASTQIS